MVYVVVVLALMMAGESWLLWRVGVALNVLERFEERLAHLSGALHLLTDTAESGFASFAGVLTEASHTGAKPARRRRGLGVRSKSDANAATRDATDGELRLRLHMSELDRLARYGEKEA